MRFGAILPPTIAHEEVAGLARTAERAGFDAIWVEEGDSTTGWPGVFVVAAAAAGTGITRVGITAVLGLEHPLYVAEEATTLDLGSGGRVEVAVRPATTAEAGSRGIDPATVRHRFAEALDIFIEAVGPAPFSYAGKYWTVPAGIDSHIGAVGHDTVFPMPKPAQIRLPIWMDSTMPARSGIAQIALDLDVSAGVQAAVVKIDDALLERGGLERLRGDGVGLVVCRFDGNQTSAFCRFGRRVAPKFRATRLPEVILEAIEADER